jgi:hypothetical protein
MSTKDLFDRNYLKDKTEKDAFKEVESAKNVNEIRKKQDTFIPQIDYSDPRTFSKYGSAVLYYKSAIDRISNYYPYDGSSAEVTKFYNDLLGVDKYILDNRYPRSTGYAIFSPDSYLFSTVTNGYAVPATSDHQHITFNGGPNVLNETEELKKLVPNSENNKFQFNNVYNEDGFNNLYLNEGLPSTYGKGTRASNLRANFDDGVTVECWIHTGSLTPITENVSKQVIFDWWNQEETSSAGYGRITLELTSSHAARGDQQKPLILTVQSGAHTTQDFLALGYDIDRGTALSDWTHLAVQIQNTGSSGSYDLVSRLFVNGELNDTAVRGAYNLTSSTGARAWPFASDNHYSSSATLQGWWRLNGGSDRFTVAKPFILDHSQNLFTGSVNSPLLTGSTVISLLGGAVMPAGAVHPARYIQGDRGSRLFNSGTAHINIGMPERWQSLFGRPMYGGTEKFTIAGWVNKNGDGGVNAPMGGEVAGYGHIISFSEGAAGAVGVYTDPSERIYIYANWDSGTNYGTATKITYRTDNSAFSLSTWSHIAITFDATDPSNLPIIYVNGKAQSVSVYGGGTASGRFWGPGTVKAPALAAEQCYIGNLMDPGFTGDARFKANWQGYLADIGIWNSVLSAAEVESIYSAYLIRIDDERVRTVNELNAKGAKGRLGALQAAQAGLTAGAGAGKLSGSVDEFRYWKVSRTAEEIGRHWFTNIHGGTNTDISNTTLGMYYKFNEGITTTSSVDSTVLDYGGRLCNGTWTGYSVNSRNTGSAIVSASAAAVEYRDPIIYSDHKSVVALQKELQSSGSFYDRQNNGMFLKTIPSWIYEDLNEDGESDLEKLSHVIGAYFDKLYLQIQAVPSFRHAQYTSASHKPFPFSQHLPQSLGLTTPQLFVDSELLERFYNRTDKSLFENDLNETKNLIYQNLYNNLASIYKAKGTEKAIRNVLRCFNINDNLIYVNAYSNNQTFELRSNTKQTQKKRKFLNLHNTGTLQSVVYLANPHSDFNKRGYISASAPSASVTMPLAEFNAYTALHPHGPEDKYGFTMEANVNFPRFNDEFDPRHSFITSSLFGMTTVWTASTAHTTFLSSSQDVANFQVLAIRDKPGSKNIYFRLSSSYDPYLLSELTTSNYYDVYDNENWNLSVAVRPKKYPYAADLISGSGVPTSFSSKADGYDVIFRGYNNTLGTITNKFELTSSLLKSEGSDILNAWKRPYVGALNLNLTGASVHKSDILVNDVKYWTAFVDDITLQKHTVDRENFGLSASYQNISPLDSLSKYHDIYRANSLLLNWQFSDVTASDAAGNFDITDFSSGSAFERDNFGWIGEKTGFLHAGYANLFPVSNTNVIENKLVNEHKFMNPELLRSSDMVQILSEDDELYGVFDEVPNYIYTVEKSLYGAVNEEILDFFAGVIDFHNIIGEPVHRYRQEYKPLNTLVQIFFEKFREITTVERYTEYYKWFDDSLTNIISQLIPASSDFVEDVQNIVESHILERAKYQTKYPTLDFAGSDPEGEIETISELLLDYVGAMYGGLEASPRPENAHREFWLKRALPGSSSLGFDYEIATDNAAVFGGGGPVDNKRRDLRTAAWRKPTGSYTSPVLVKTEDGTATLRYTPTRAMHTPTTLYASEVQNRVIKGGVNFTDHKDIHYTHTSLYPAGPIFSPSGGVFLPQNVLYARTKDFEATSSDSQWRDEGGSRWRAGHGKTSIRGEEKLTSKQKLYGNVYQGRDFDGGYNYTNNKTSFAFPFNIISASITGGVDNWISNRVGNGITITNVHNDVYGPDMEIPLQGPFTEKYVGGHQSRHIKINTGSDNYTNRPEAWKILLGQCIDATEADHYSDNSIPYGSIPASGSIGMASADYPWPEANEVSGTPYPMTASQKATYYRGMMAKRPVNIRNILMKTGSSTVIGNFQNNYEVIHSVGAFENPRNFVDQQPLLPSNVFQERAINATQVRTLLGIRRGDDGHFNWVDEYNVGYLTAANGGLAVSDHYRGNPHPGNKSIITSRFSAIGAIEVAAAGYKDIRSNEYSVYNALNNRYQTVIKKYQGPSGTWDEPTAGAYGRLTGTTAIRVSDIHGKPYGYVSHLARHTARFGRDSLFMTQSGELPGSNDNVFSELPGFHKIHRNRRRVIVSTNEANTAFATSSKFDNFFIQHPIPRSTQQYLWITRSLKSNNEIYGFVPSSFLVSKSSGFDSAYDFVSASDIVSSNSIGYIQSTNNLNLLVYEPIDSGSRTIGTSSNTSGSSHYLLTKSTPNPEVDHFNLLNTKRGYIYGYGGGPSFARNPYNPLLRDQKTRNKISVLLRHHHEEFSMEPVSMKGRPVFVNMDHVVSRWDSRLGMEKSLDNTTLRTSHNNELILFNDRKLNDWVNIIPALDNQVTPFEHLVAMKDRRGINLHYIVYTENVLPSTRMEFLSRSTTRVGYDNQFWRDSADERIAQGIYFTGQRTIDAIAGTLFGRPIDSWQPAVNSQGLFNSINPFSGSSKGTLSIGYPLLATGVGSNRPTMLQNGLTQSIWPLDAPGDFLTRTEPPMITRWVHASESAHNPTNTYSWASLVNSNSAGELQNTYSLYHQILSSSGGLSDTFTNGPIPSASLEYQNLALCIRNGAVYARKHMLNSPLSVNSPNSIPVLSDTPPFNTTGSAKRTGGRPGTEANNAALGYANIKTGSGEALWDAPTTAGYLTKSATGPLNFISAPSKPWYNDYDEFRYDIKTVAKGFAVIPEFRISEHIEDYAKLGPLEAEDFDTFEIPGTNLSSSQSSFYKDYANTDFLKEFFDVKQMSDLNGKELALTCMATLKFNPYKGFYPVQRTLDLVSQFSRSFSEGFSVSSINEDGKRVSTTSNILSSYGYMRPLYQPLFAPGILYNSIKSGMAVDYPVVLNGSKVRFMQITGSPDANNKYPENWLLATRINTSSVYAGSQIATPADPARNYVSGALWDLRVPFEAIIDPSKDLKSVYIPDLEPNPSASLRLSLSAAFTQDPGDNLYTLMASNFFSEVGRFFLKGGQYTQLRSSGLSLKDVKFPPGAVYGARLKLRASNTGGRTYEHESGSDGAGTFYAPDGAISVFRSEFGGTVIPSSSAGPASAASGTFQLPQDPAMNPDFKQNFVMYSRPTAFGPSITGRNFGGFEHARPVIDGRGDLFALSASNYGVKDSLNGYNWAYTPPYYHGEAWADMIFRPSASISYDLQRILQEIVLVQRRYDPGPELPWNPHGTETHKSATGLYFRSLVRDHDFHLNSGSQQSQNYQPYASENINANAMQIDSCFNLFGVENVPVVKSTALGPEIEPVSTAAQRWVIQPKFETPMLNFADTGIRPITASYAARGHGGIPSGSSTLSLPLHASESVPRGMWHQFGILPDSPTKGVFVEIGDIPANWLENHYEVVTGSSIYNNFSASEGPDIYKNMKSLSKLMGFSGENTSARMGEIAEKRVIREAVVAVPYILERGLEIDETAPDPDKAIARKRFINIQRSRFEAALPGPSISGGDTSLNAAGQSVRKLIQKMGKYVLPPQFDFLNNRELQPVVMYMFEFAYELDKNDLSYIWQNLAPRDYKKLELRQVSTAHRLNFAELLSEKDVMENPNLRWMVFKVKQRGQSSYNDMTVPQAGEVDTTVVRDTPEGYPLRYNWPYDFVSIVESIKFDVTVLYGKKISEHGMADPRTGVFSRSRAETKVNRTLNKKLRRKKKV